MDSTALNVASVPAPTPRRAGRAILALLALLATQWAAGGEATPTAGGGADAWHERGRSVYNYRCYFCHGYSGDGRTVAATYLDPPPRDFTAAGSVMPSREAMLETVRRGRPGTAMKGFETLLAAQDVAAVVDFVRTEFMTGKRVNARYHSAANGWAGEARDSPAAPFVAGSVGLDEPWETLTPEAREGRRLFLSTCVACHARGDQATGASAWRTEAVSYPPGNYLEHGEGDEAVAAAFEVHETPPPVPGLSAQAKRGEALYQDNCAQCHAADGTGRNWIGSFLVPPPPDLTSARAMAAMTRDRLADVIRNGIPGTSMSAWRGILDESQIGAISAYVSAAFHPLAD